MNDNIEIAIKEVEKEFESAADSAIEARAAYVKNHSKSFVEVFDEDLDANVWRSDFGYDIEPSCSFFTIPELDGGCELFTSFEYAAEASLEAFYDNKDEYKPSADLTAVMQFEAALNRLGIPVDRVKDAGTGTKYAYVGDLKIRFANHDALYDADFSVSPNEGSWKDAVRFVLSR